jgi:hypothetical protein
VQVTTMSARRCASIRRSWTRALALLAALPASAVIGSAQTVRPCASAVIVDPEAPIGPGATGGILDLDQRLPATSNTQPVASGREVRFLSHAASVTGRTVYVTDLEADPSFLGQDPNGNPGRGAVFLLQDFGLLPISDGTQCGSTIANCDPGIGGVFVDPVGIAWSHALDVLAIVDPDADPSGLGPDNAGFAGHGAVLRVNPTSGIVDLVADGSRYQPGIPMGPSIFEDPVALTFDRAGNLYVADQLARPAGTTNAGAIFRVDVATGDVTLVAASPQFVALRDVAAEPSGTLLVLDRLAGGRGTLFRVAPANGAVVAALSWPLFVEPAGVVVTGSGRIFVVDTSADPTAAGSSGAVFEVDPMLSGAVVVSATPDYASPWSIEMLDPEALEAAVPSAGDAGSTLDVSLFGGVFLDTPTVDFGPDITVNSVTYVSAQEIVANVTISPTAMAGSRDVRVLNPDITFAFHCELFEVIGVPPCAPSAPVGGTLRLTKPEDGRVRITWDGTGDSCTAGYRVYRAFTAVPGARPGAWPGDPNFDDVTAADADMDWLDTDFDFAATAGSDEYYLVVPVGTDGSEGPVEHYGR